MTIISNKIQKEHPGWKLPDRRVKKFVRRHTKGHKNPAGADEDATLAVMSTMTSTKKTMTKLAARSTNLLRIISPRRTNAGGGGGGGTNNQQRQSTVTSTPTNVDGNKNNTTPNSSAPPSPTTSVEKGGEEPEKTTADVTNDTTSMTTDVAVVEDMALTKKESNVTAAYETDDNKEHIKTDFCDACSIM